MRYTYMMVRGFVSRENKFTILGQSDKRGTGMRVTGPWHSMTKNQQNSSSELIRVQRGEVPEDLGGLSSSDSQDLAID